MKLKFLKVSCILTFFVCLLSFAACDGGILSSPFSSSGEISQKISSSEDNSSGGGQVEQPTSTFKSYAAVSEGMNLIWSESNAANAKVYYKLSSENAFVEADSELTRDNGQQTARCDLVGLKAGSYDVRIITSAGENISIKNIVVTAYDRSGYAHFGFTSGIGAYNDDGTLKSNAIVVYVNESNKNTVTANGKTGIAAILKSATGVVPIAVRIIGQVATNTRNASGSFYGNYGKISGLTDKATGDGQYYNMLDIEGCRNITIEGIGEAAEIYQWGFTFKLCNSIEVRNLIFSNYPEDACAFQGLDSSPAGYGNYWVHNNRFNVGKNEYDTTAEKDKGYGDGATDIKFCHNATYSYNQYVGCKKTGLIGGSDSNKQYNITFHHNYFDSCNSRMPLCRQANVHYYNNFFEKAGSYVMSARANCLIFSEANMVENCSTYRDNGTGGAIKSFNDVFENSPTGSISRVSNREQTVANSCTYGTSFDTDSNKFYYDSERKTTKVAYITAAEKAKTDCQNYAGVNKANPTAEDFAPATGTEGTSVENEPLPTQSSQSSGQSSSPTASSSAGGSATTPEESGFSKVYSLDLESYAVGDKLSTSAGTLPYSNANSNSNCVYVVEDDGIKKANLFDNSSSARTELYLPISSQASGICRVYATIKPTTNSGRWTLINFIGTSCFVRADDVSNFAYSTTGNENNLTSSSIGVVANTSYEIIAEFNYNANTVSFSVNGTAIAENVSFNGGAITQLDFITSNSGIRNLMVESIEIYHKN